VSKLNISKDGVKKTEKRNLNFVEGSGVDITVTDGEQDDAAEITISAAAGSGVTDADYLVGTAHADLSAEIVVGTTPGGELGGTWASPTVDATHSGSTHAATQAAAEATAAAALTTHEGAADPHTGYVKENDASWVDLTDSGQTALHSHAGGGGAPAAADYLVGTADGDLSNEIVVGTTPGGELGGTWASPTVDATHAGSTHSAAVDTHIADVTDVHDHGSLAGLLDDDHTQYLKEADFDDIDFLVGTATGHTGAEIVVGTSPGGELGGTWASPTVDATHSGSTHGAAVTTHEAAGDPHTGYRLESADHTHATTGLQAGTVAHSALTGLTTGDDHTQYQLESGLQAVKFSVGALLEGAPPANGFRMIWRAPFACTVTNVRTHIDAGTNAVCNARKNQASDFLASDFTNSTADAWGDGGAVQNTAIAAGDDIEVELVSTSGAVTQVNIQVDLTRIIPS
jgi:hypothetical protein